MSQGIAQAIRDQRRDRILQAAREVFFEYGYGATTMSTIAARLGGSKATLYAYFRNKEDLFEEIIRDQCAVIQDILSEIGGDGDLRAALTKLGLEILTVFTGDQAVRTLQLIVQEAGRNPELARRFDEAGPKLGLARISAYLQAAHDRGEIHTPDPAEAAGVLISLLRGEMQFRRMLGLEPQPGAAAIAHEVETAIDVFLTYYKVR